MRNRIIVVLCILLIGVLGCSDVIRYDPGFHPVGEETFTAESIESVEDEQKDILNNTPTSVMPPEKDILWNESAYENNR